MRHNKKFNHLGRTKAHRDAMLSNMATSLILHKRIFTTLAKAKALRVYVEPLINRATRTRRSKKSAAPAAVTAEAPANEAPVSEAPATPAEEKAAE